MARSVAFNEEEAIRKAMEVFWEKGYNGASLRDLTDAMKINSSSLYNTIGDKQELAVRCVRHYTEGRKKDLQRRAEGPGSPLDILVQYIHDAVDMIVREEKGCMAVKMAFEVATTDPRVKEILKADSDHTYRFLHRQIRKAMEQGEIASDDEPELLADYFISAWIGWYESYILHKNPVKIRKMARYFIRQLTR